MKFGLAYPRYERYPKWDWIAQAARSCGHDVCVVRSLEELLAADRECDAVVFAQHLAGIQDAPSIAKGHKAAWVTWQFDTLALQVGTPILKQPGLVAFIDRNPIPTPQLTMLRCMDLVLCKDRGYFSDLARLRLKLAWFDQACPSMMGECEHRDAPDWDVLIYGHTDSAWRDRQHDVRTLTDAGFRVAWAGHDSDSRMHGVEYLEYCPALDLPSLASRAAVTLCSDFRHDIDSYISDRLWLALGMGAFVVRRKSPGLPVPPDGSQCYATYSSAAELVTTVRDAVEFPDIRRRMGARARTWVMEHHTYERRIEELVSILEEVIACKARTPASAECATAPA